MHDFLRVVPYPLDEIVICTDNHGAHRSNLVKKYLEGRGLALDFMPAYSSVLSPVERVWWIFKQAWIKQLSKVTYKYDPANLERDIQLLCDQIRGRLTFKIRHTADWYFNRCIRGHLV